MCIIFSLTTEFRQCFRQFFSQWFTCLFELEGISPNHTLLLNPWYDLNYQRRIVRWSSLVEFTETLIGMQWVHGSYSKTVEGSDFRWPLSSISMHSIKSRPWRGFFPPRQSTATFFKSNGRIASKMMMDHQLRKIGVFLSEFWPHFIFHSVIGFPRFRIVWKLCKDDIL